MSDVRTVKLKFSQLEFLEDNPRTIKEPNLKRLSERIKDDPTFFDNRPCLVNFIEGRYICYAGFQRAHAAAKVLKWKEIPCSVENDVAMDLMRRRAIYDNTHDGEWDADVLANVWEYEVDELKDMGVPEWVFGGAELSEEEMNRFFQQQQDGASVDQKKVLALEYTEEDYTAVKDGLLKVAKTPEEAVWQLLKL